jgi:hypothetical protein
VNASADWDSLGLRARHDAWRSGEADRLWFARHPHRKHLLRPATWGEVVITGGREPSPGAKYYVLIKSVHTDMLKCVFASAGEVSIFCNEAEARRSWRDLRKLMPELRAAEHESKQRGRMGSVLQ